MAVKKKTREVNREGQRWTEDRPGMTLRLPIDLREAVTEESRVKGDLAKIVLFALAHVERKDVDTTPRARPERICMRSSSSPYTLEDRQTSWGRMI